MRLEKKQAPSELSKDQIKENRTPGYKSGGQENIFWPPPLSSAKVHSSSFPPSREPLSLSFLSVVPSLSFSPLPPPHAVACIHMRPYDLALFSSLRRLQCFSSHPRSLAASSTFLPPGRRNTHSLSNGPPNPLRASLKKTAPFNSSFSYLSRCLITVRSPLHFPYIHNFILFFLR